MPLGESQPGLNAQKGTLPWAAQSLSDWQKIALTPESAGPTQAAAWQVGPVEAQTQQLQPSEKAAPS
jgi:hypothetical protein